MTTIKDKMGQTQTAKPHKIRATNFDNIKMSRDQHILYYRKQDEIDAKLELERQALQAKADEEIRLLEEAGRQDNALSELKETTEEV